jgi:hypothetical protein
VLAAAPAAAQTTPASTVTLSGTVRNAAGATVPAATVRATGPASGSTSTDANGAFSLTLPQGIYRIDVSKGGYEPASISQVALTSGTTQPLTITLAQADLSSLQTIGHVSTGTRGSGSTINTGSAASGYLSAQAFADLGTPQLIDVLQHLPDVNVQHMGSQQDTSIIVNGAQPYETQVLLDGHPIGIGQYGVFLAQYFPTYLLGGVETQSGPGNTTPFANIAVGGTVNLTTPGFTKATTAQLTVGTDQYSSQYSSLIATGSAGHLEYVVGLGDGSYNGPYFQTQHCIVTPANGGALDNEPGNTGIISSCGDASGSFFNKGELLKLHYDFTPTTSLEAEYVGAFGGYTPQGTAWGVSLGPTKIVNCIDGNICTNPQNASQIGSTINGYAWYPGAQVYSNQDFYDATLRTAIGNDTLLVRPYLAQLEPETYLDVNQSAYPEYFGPVGATDPTTGAGAAFESTCSGSFYDTTSPTGKTVVKDGQLECFGSPYATAETDKLYGSTFSYIHPFGDSVLNFSYDFHATNTFAFLNDPANVVVPPGSTTRYSTFSLTSDLHLIRNLGINVGLYDTHFTDIGTEVDTAGGQTGFRNDVTRFDPHLAFVFRPKSNLSYRAAYGTSTTFPFIGELSGVASYEHPASTLPPQYAQGGILTNKNPNLLPETAIEYGVGADYRLKNNSVLSLDLQDNVIHNVFEDLTTTGTASNGFPEGIITPENVARLGSQLATLRYAYAPRRGLGYSLSATADRAILTGVPASVGSIQIPANNVQICGNGTQNPGIPTCIPYLKGYEQTSYRWGDGTYMALGVDYEGKNNTYFQPPFALVDFTYRHPVTKQVDLQVGVENLLNTNNYGEYLSIPNGGTPIVADNPNGSQTSFVPTEVSAPPRLIRLQLTYHFGR